MEMKLKQLRRKQNDIGQFERDKKVKMEMQQYEQGINYTQAKFFSTCEEEFRKIANDAERQQKALKQREKIKRLKKKQNQKQSNVSQMLMLNIIIDYLRSNNINYSYSVLMREKNILNQDLVMKSQLVSLFNLKEEFDNHHRFNVSLLELILNKLQHFNQLINNKKLSTNEFSIQCQLITSQNNHNNLLLTEIKLQQIRNQTEIRQKKHFESQLHLFKSQQLLKLKTDMQKLFQNKQQQLSQKYQTKIQSLINQNTQSSPHQHHTKKLQQYLNQINTLKQELRSQKQRSIKLEKQKLEHDCFQNQQIQNKIEQIQTQRKQLSQLKSQFQLALRNMGTKVEDLALQKQKIMENGKKQTEQYLNKNKIYRQNKDYMIEKVYSTLKSFQIRIDHLSVDNNKLYQENEILKRQLNSLKLKDQQLKKLEETKRHLSISDLKVPTKNASIGVTPQQFQNNQLQQSKLQSEKSILTYTSQQFQDKMKQRTQQNQRINKLKLEMSLLKNKVKYLVMDFQ